MGLLSLFLLATGTVATGYAFLHLARCSVPSALQRFGLAVATGFAGTGLLLQGVLLVTGRVFFWPAVVLQALASGVLVQVRLRGLREGARFQRGELALLAVVALAVSFTAWRAPFVGYDGKAIFGYKAKVLYFERDLRGAPFQDPDVAHYHADYPLALPLLMAYSAWASEGATSDPRGQAPASSPAEWVERYDAVDAYLPLAALWIVGLLALVFGAARARFGGGPLSWFALVLSVPVVVVFPWAGGGSWSLAGADSPLALVLGAIAVLLLPRGGDDARPRRELALTALLAAFAIGLKADAVLGLGTLLLALALTRRAMSGNRGRAIATAAGLAAGYIVVRAIAARTAGAPYAEDYVGALKSANIGALVDRLPLFLSSTWDALASRGMALYWLAVLCVGVPLGWRAGGAVRCLSTWLALFIGVCSAVFLLTPNHVAWHTATALPRLWCQLIVPAGLLVVSAAADLWSGLRVRVVRPPVLAAGETPAQLSSSSPPRYPSARKLSRIPSSMSTAAPGSSSSR